MKKLAIVTTHPIQYYAPVFKLLAGLLQVRVFYTWGEASVNSYDPGFGKTIKWDIDLLDGYDYEWVINTSANPGSHHFKGIINPQLTSRITSFQPDAVLVFGWAYQSHLRALLHFKNTIPVYFRGDSTLLGDRTGIKRLLRSLFLRWVYRYIDCAFFVGTNNENYFSRHGLKKAQLVFAPHAIDNDRFAVNRDHEVLLLKKKLNIPIDHIIILFAGKLEPVKNPLLLLNSFIFLNKADVHLLFVGNGQLEPSLKKAASAHGNVHFMGFQNQSYMPVIYQACDLFCLVSRSESWGLAVNEAMACGKPILASDQVGCAVDLVSTGYNGSIFESGNKSDLQEKLISLTASKEALKILGENSLRMIKSWNFTKVTRAIVNRLQNEKN